MSRYGYGAKPPATHFSAWKFTTHLAATLPRPSIFDAYTGPARALLEDDDQNGYGACVGFATAQLVRYIMVKAGGDDTGPLSPWWVWDATKAWENNGDDIQNVGTDPHNALTIVRNHGIPPLDAYASERAHVLGQFESARYGQGIEFYQCATVNELLNGMGTMGVPGNLCIAVYDDFETPHADETVDDPTGAVLGYHNLLVRAYDDSRQIVRLHNQWKGWTADNEVTLTYAQLEVMFSQAYIVSHPAIATPADAFWAYWGAAGDEAVAKRSTEKLSEQSRVLGQWLPYLLTHHSP